MLRACAMRVLREEQAECSIEGCGSVDVRRTNHDKVQSRRCSKHGLIAGGAAKLGERLGSGDGERNTLLTRQIAFEPLPASVLFAFVRADAFR